MDYLIDPRDDWFGNVKGALVIPVQGYAGQTVAVLGLGRSGRATAAALLAGGAQPVVWDDSAVARQAAEEDGHELRDLSKAGGGGQ